MDIRRPESDPIDRPQPESQPTVRADASPRRGRRVLLACVLGAALSGAAPPAEPPPEPVPAPPEVPAPLGASAAALRERFAASLYRVEVKRAGSVFQQIAPQPEPAPVEEPGEAEEAEAPYPQERLARRSGGDVQRVEYDLAEDRVYRVRWRLAERFERPVMDAVVKRLAQRLGPPDYDQTLRAEVGSERADLRRTGWTSQGRALEIRQLHPFTGGPVFLSLADVEAMQRIVDAKASPLPPPETTGPWWKRPQRPPTLVGDAERDALVEAIEELVAKLAQPLL